MESHRSEVWGNDDLVRHIIRYVGPGYYVFVSSVNRTFQELYEECFAEIPQEKLPKIKHTNSRRITLTQTFYKAAFASQSCVEFWHQSLPMGVSVVDPLALVGTKECPWGGWSCHNAAERGNLEELKFLHENGCPWNKMTSMKAVEGGHVEILRYLHEENNCPWDSLWDSFRTVAARGHLEVLMYLSTKRGKCRDSGACWRAALNGHFEVLKFLRENGCPWDSLTAQEGVRGGHLEILRYLREQGCPGLELEWKEDNKE